MSATTGSPAPKHQNGVREIVSETAESLAAGARDCTEHFVTEPAKDLLSLAKDYAREHPEVAAAWAFGLGMIVGWRIKPW